MARLILLVFALSALACQKPSFEECEKLCWRYVELGFWEEFDSSVKGMPEAEVEKLRAAKLEEWEALRAAETNHNRDNCVTSCRRGGEKSMVPCVEKALTVAEAKACIEDD